MAQEARSTEIVNPYIAGSPVTGTAMFFGREDVFAFIRQALTGQHRDNIIVLYGQRRTGKTSVLYQMSRHLDARHLCIFVDLHGLALDGIDGFLWELASHMARTLRREHRVEVPRLDRAEFMADARGAFENEFLGQVWSAIGDRHVLLMLDEAIRLQEQVRAGKLGGDVFEYLRHLMQHHERLNFLFALGSGLEEMEKEYAFLFSVGLYKKISFLDSDAATALITRPAQGHYEVAPSAVERILQITSGHAYYTQLVCHSLFNRWQQGRKPLIQAADVDATLGEVIERGLAVLKHVWEESTPGEKAILAGLAAAMGERNRPVSTGDVDRAWAQHGVRLPNGEKSKAIKSLIARDVMAGQDRYQFTVDLQRLWVAKYERLEWVKEEIGGELEGWQAEAVRQAAPRRVLGIRLPLLATTILFALVLLTFLLLVQYILGQRQVMRQVFESSQATSTAVARILREATISVSQYATAEAGATTGAIRPGTTATAAVATLRAAAATSTAVADELPVNFDWRRLGDAQRSGDDWVETVRIEPTGGDGTFVVFYQVEPVFGPPYQVQVRALGNGDGKGCRSMTTTIGVDSAGQNLQKAVVFEPPPGCDQWWPPAGQAVTPTPTPRPTPTRVAQTVYTNTFEDTAGPGWSHTSIDSTPNGRRFLGPFGDAPAQLTLTDLPPHAKITVSFDLFIIRSWDGNGEGGGGPDSLSVVSADGIVLLDATFSNVAERTQTYPDGGNNPARTGAENITLGYTCDETARCDSVYRLSRTLDHSANSLTLIFASSVTSPGDETFGLDNVQVIVLQ